jgi:hypothetical protein
MMKLPNLAGFEGLIDLDRRGIDIRPTLLRVLTDQYLHRRDHTLDEERQYTELTLRLLDETDVAARATVAARLAPHAIAPRAILLRLARDVLTVAEPVLRLSPKLTQDELAAVARERGPSHAAVIARRALPDPAPPQPAPQAAPAAATALAAPIKPDIAPASRPAPPQPKASSPEPTQQPTQDIPDPAAETATATAKPDLEAKELSGLFFAADPAERRLILISLEFLPTPPPTLPQSMQQIDVWRFESAALQHKTETVIQDLERALGISRKLAMRIIDDNTGEPIVAAAKAMQLPTDVLQRILLFMNPRVGQSVDRVYELAGLYEEITADAARRLVGIWRDADPPDQRATKNAALWQDAVEQARTALSDITRHAPTPRRNTPSGLLFLRQPSDKAAG